MKPNQPNLTKEQFEQWQLTIVAAQMLPYFFSNEKSYRYGDILLKSPYEKAAITAKLMLDTIINVHARP